MSIDFINVISIKGDKPIYGTQRYPVSEETTIELMGEFRSSGKEKSKIFFGLQCFDEKGEEIEAYKVFRIKESLVLKSINSDGKSFSLIKKPEQWINSDEKAKYDMQYRKYLGFYYDGNINRLPDYIIKSPAYNNFSDNIIYLKTEIPKEIIEKIKPCETRVMNQFGNSAYDYSAAYEEIVPEIWKQFSATYNGFSEGYGDIKGKYRLGTKSVTPVVLCNYNQNENAILEIKNVQIIIKDKPKFK